MCTEFQCQEAMVAFGHERELVTHYHVEHGCSMKASRRRVEQELAASVEMPVDSRYILPAWLNNPCNLCSARACHNQGGCFTAYTVYVSSICRNFHCQLSFQNAQQAQLPSIYMKAWHCQSVWKYQTSKRSSAASHRYVPCAWCMPVSWLNIHH